MNDAVERLRCLTMRAPNDKILLHPEQSHAIIAHIDALTAKLAAAERERDAERATVVAWLRTGEACRSIAAKASAYASEVDEVLELAADAIEAGQHRENG